MTSTLPPAPAFGAPVSIEPHPDVLRFLATRRSASALGLEAPGPDATQLADLLRLATRAPDHGKLAPWRFILLEGDDKRAFVERLEIVAQERADASAVAKLAKLRAPPLAVTVISSPKASAIPPWEQELSAAAVCVNLLYAAAAMGFGGNWITDWYSYDPQALAVLGLSPGERVAGFILLGTPRDPPQERERPDPQALTQRWRPG